VLGWADEYPHSNVGVVATQEYWMLDVDDVSWFMEHAPGAPPKTLVVQTGSGKLHLYFKHSADSRKLRMSAVMNPKWKRKTDADPGTPDEPQKFMEYPDQVVGPGSVHPDTKKVYRIIKDEPLAECPDEWVKWLKALETAKLNPGSMRVNPLRRGWDPDVELEKAGLKYDRSERDGKVYYNYHASHGKCLVRGSSHAAQGEVPNPRQCAFVHDPVSGEFWHQCFSGGCQIPGKTRIALEVLGLKLEDVVRPAWTELFETFADFSSAKELSWTIEGYAHEETFNMIGGLSGHGKTWVAMLLAKSFVTGERLFDNFNVLSCPGGVMYLVPEAGRRSFWKRVKLLRMERLIEQQYIIVRTMSMGPVVPLSDKRIIQAAKGRDVILDTAVRFMEGDESAAHDNNLAAQGFALLSSGARSVWGIHHSPKSLRKDTSLELENVLRGSGDIGAMLATCVAVRQMDPDKNSLYVQVVKGRDLDEMPKPFMVEGRPWIEKEGRFHMVKPPGECGFLDEELTLVNGNRGGAHGQKGASHGIKGGRPANDERTVEILRLFDEEKISAAEIAKRLGNGLTKNAVYKILSRAKKSEQGDLQEDDDEQPPDF
jgi:hypothetical protein